MDDVRLPCPWCQKTPKGEAGLRIHIEQRHPDEYKRMAREEHAREIERRLRKTGILIIGPIVALGVIAFGVFGTTLTSDDSLSVVSLLWAAPAMALLFAFLGLTIGYPVGMLVGNAVGSVWRNGDFFAEGGEIGGWGGAVGGAIGGALIALLAVF
ncbi:MAG TPA: hypothetical protein VFB41_00445 [Solirubrobacteraceae bacterium]|nr:hypothetical protein [Solirubrobacteraceae bacterium]